MARRRSDVSMFEVLKDAGKTGISRKHDIAPESATDPIVSRGSTDSDLLLGKEGGNSGGEGSKRKKVALDDPALKIPTTRTLPSMEDSLRSSPSDSFPWWQRTIEFRFATVFLVAVGFLLGIFLAFQLGYQQGTSDLPAVMENSDDPLWHPVVDPTPEPIEVIKSAADEGGLPIAIVPSTVETPEVSLKPAVHVEPRRMYVVMVAQTLRDPGQTDRLVRFLNNQAIGASANVLTGRGRDGTRMSVFVGPFEDRVEAQRVCSDVRRLRRAVGTDFKESYPTRVEFSVDELERFGVPVKQ